MLRVAALGFAALGVAALSFAAAVVAEAEERQGKEEQYEQKRIEFIANWGAKHDPGSWKQRKANFREWCRKLDNAKWYDFGFWLKTFFSE